MAVPQIIKDLTESIASIFKGGSEKKRKKEEFRTLKRLLDSTEINPNRRKRSYSESETIAYLTRKVASLEKQIKRLTSQSDSTRDRLDNYIKGGAAATETKNGKTDLKDGPSEE
jgi:hypothetical protein